MGNVATHCLDFFVIGFLLYQDITYNMDGSLTINVRSPSMSETMTLTTDRDASVRSLKRLIHTVHPKKPSINDQRIIFAGKLLNDGDILSRILEKVKRNRHVTESF